MKLRVRFEQPSLREVLFALLLLGGLVPLALANLLLISAVPRDGRLLETGAIVAGGQLLLAGIAWLLSGWAVAGVAEPAKRLSEALAGMADGRFESWVRPAGAVRELAELSGELNRTSGLLAQVVRERERSVRDNATLATDSMRLFRQAVQAKEPLTKHHPGLLEAYSRAVARQLGGRDGKGDPSEVSLSPFIDPEKGPGPPDTRSQPRYRVEELTMRSPVGARVVDVGAVGMGLETMERLPLGRQDDFELVARSRRLRLPGRVAWCRLVRTVKTAAGDLVPVYRAGVSFGESFSSGARDELQEIIRTHRKVA